MKLGIDFNLTCDAMVIGEFNCRLHTTEIIKTEEEKLYTIDEDPTEHDEIWIEELTDADLIAFFNSDIPRIETIRNLTVELYAKPFRF